MRIALTGISHETNTYCKDMTPASAFYVLRGEDMLQTTGQESDVGGAVDACRALGVEPVPVLFANTQPSGTIEREGYEALKAEIVAGLIEAAPLDGCVLLLHGAGVVDGLEDLEGDLAAVIRETLGDLPIAASFDLHGNVTQAMADALNGVFACHHYPHIDMHKRAAEAVALVKRCAETGERTECRVWSLPMLLPTTTTFEGIGQEMLERLLTLEAQSGCVDISWFHGFPYTDIRHVGCHVVTTGMAGQGEAEATEFAQTLWARRQDFIPESLSGPEAVSRAQSIDRYPVVIHETSDNCGAGAPGDGTHLLHAMLEAGLGSEACFAFLVDAEVAAEAHRAGVKSSIRVSLGGKYDDMHGAPLVIEAYVKALHDGRLTLTHMFKGMPLNLGPMARLVVDGMDIVVASRRSQTFDEEPFRAVGIDVRRYKYVALKSSSHFRGCFQDLAGAIVTADTPGLSTHDIGVFPRQRSAQALWPIHPEAQYP